MKRTFKSLLAVAGLAFIGVGSLLIAAPAHAAIVCDPQGVTLNNYPLDGNGNANNTHAFRCKNTTTGVMPTDARSNEYFFNIAALNPNVKSVLKSRGVKFFFFNNRDEANQYFNATAPYAGRPDGVFASSTARCGQTGYHPTIGTFGELQQTIAVAIYDLCTVTQVAGPYRNPDLKRIPYHEAGHAFDFALASQKTNGRGVTVSNATGSQDLFARDKDNLTPANWSTAAPQ
ncbi:MAG: hypothetical protein HC888_17455 [Candidatus Competibacteraceae bacterium]|nr:hypothetical protein [Candidatus Competibacteraceae bacterium]